MLMALQMSEVRTAAIYTAYLAQHRRARSSHVLCMYARSRVSPMRGTTCAHNRTAALNTQTHTHVCARALAATRQVLVLRQTNTHTHARTSGTLPQTDSEHDGEHDDGSLTTVTRNPPHAQEDVRQRGGG